MVDSVDTTNQNYISSHKGPLFGLSPHIMT